MTALRSLYVRYLRGTALGDAARATYHGLRHLRGREPASTPRLPLRYRMKLFASTEPPMSGDTSRSAGSAALLG